MALGDRSRLRHALGYPRAYVRALATRRRIRASGATPTEALRLARSLRIGPTQADEELYWLLDLLRADPPRTIVEIGTDEGGTLLVWTRAGSPDALLVALDARPLGLLGTFSPWAIARRGFARSGQSVVLLMPADSHDPRTLHRLRRRLGGRSIDFLFID